MLTVKQVSLLTGVSVRTLQYYDKIGLLKPTMHTEAGYRLYDDAALELLQQILLFRELEFSLKDIAKIISSPGYDKNKALQQHIELLTLKKEHLENLIDLARGIKETGEKNMSFEAFDKKQIEDYTTRAKAQWGDTPQFAEFEVKNDGRSDAKAQELGDRLMAILAKFGELKEKGAGAPEVQTQVRRLQDFITENYYKCTDEILASLGQMYAAGGEFTENINAAGGPGTAEFAAEAIAFKVKI